ncbi:MAG: mandelate racemase/muconate lactonizing enzyme family protein [Alphaproteobacteria bacterium]|nr:mandelate racemase/muconate lactonizing enzyme family protein [Alphaproteobacteria bacterium]
MKITKVSPYLIEATQNPCDRAFIFARVETSDGIVGWGEAYVILHRERAIVENIKALGGMLMSIPDPSPQSFVDSVINGFDSRHPSIDLSSAVSALEVALWDIRGKVEGKPVCRLLGDVIVDRVPLYANMWPTEPEPIGALVERCIAIKDRGFRALKIYPMMYEPLAEATDCVRRVRAAIGDKMDMMIDAAVLDDSGSALAAAKAFEPFRPYWFEEPVAGERLDAMAEIRHNTNMPIVTGEKQSGMHHFRNVLEKQAADILNPDIVGAGGILEILKIAALAKTHAAQVSPHCWDSMAVALAAMVHVCAVMPNALAGEYFPEYVPFCEQFARLDLVIADGTAALSDTPGLGVHMDEGALAAYLIK